MANILHEFMDRCSSGVTLANADLIDTESLQGKPMLPGVLNLVKLKRTGAPGSVRMADALYQFQFEIREEAFSYLDKLAYNAQMFAGIPPQVYGGAGNPRSRPSAVATATQFRAGQAEYLLGKPERRTRESG